MSTTVNVPTCNYTEYKFTSPYDPDLQTTFNNQITSDFKNRDDSNSCSMCQQNMSQLGYSNTLYDCSTCMGFSNSSNPTNYPLLSQAWGCDTCATVVAPVSYYESIQNNQSPVQMAGADKLEQYLNDLTYKNNVDVKWASSSWCDKGTTIKSLCINSSIPSFSMNVPPQTQGPATPTASSEFPVWAIVLIVVVGLIFIGGLVWYFWPWRAGGITFRSVYGRRGSNDGDDLVLGREQRQVAAEPNPEINAEDIESEVRAGNLNRQEADFLLGR